MNKPTDAEFYTQLEDQSGVLKPNTTFLKEHFFREGRLADDQALFILEQATAILKQEPNMIAVEPPVTSKHTSS